MPSLFLCNRDVLQYRDNLKIFVPKEGLKALKSSYSNELYPY